MKKPAEYRRNADECRKLAEGTLSGEDRTRLLDMAQNWVDLAASREELLAKHPELDRSGLFVKPPQHTPPPAQAKTVKVDAGQGVEPPLP